MRRDSRETQHKLIAAAEQLFAERGIDGVSLSEINRQAQQKNRNAVLYHFGSKEALLTAVLNKHAVFIEQQRAGLLAQLGSPARLRDAVEALVLPVAARLDDPDGGIAFIRINSQMMANQAYADLRLARAQNLTQARQLAQVLADLTPTACAEAHAAKMLLVDCMVFQGLADWCSRSKKIGLALLLATLINSIELILMAPTPTLMPKAKGRGPRVSIPGLGHST